MAKEEMQRRHEALIDSMNQFKQFQDAAGKPLLEKRDSLISIKELSSLRASEINQGAVILSDFFNMSGGSIGDIDLYRLLQAYFLDPEKRKEINRILGY